MDANLQQDFYPFASNNRLVSPIELVPSHAMEWHWVKLSSSIAILFHCFSINRHCYFNNILVALIKIYNSMDVLWINTKYFNSIIQHKLQSNQPICSTTSYIGWVSIPYEHFNSDNPNQLVLCQLMEYHSTFIRTTAHSSHSSPVKWHRSRHLITSSWESCRSRHPVYPSCGMMKDSPSELALPGEWWRNCFLICSSWGMMQGSACHLLLSTVSVPKLACWSRLAQL